MLTWVVLALILAGIGFFVWAAYLSERVNLIGEFVVFTDAAATERFPAVCAPYDGLQVTISDAKTGEVLWRGTTAIAERPIRLPDWGCHVGFKPGDVIVVDRYLVEVEGLGTRTYSYSQLEDNFHIIGWPDIGAG